MRILLLNTSELTGGAAIACNRLMHALNANGCEAKMLVRDKQTNDPNVVSVNNGKFKRLLNKWRFYWERGVIFLHNHFLRKDLFRVSIANTGNDISQHPLVKEADIIHLHWVNQGFLSIRDIKKLTLLGKPIVWTMHDQWPYTAICHYVGGCDKFTSQCHHCVQLHQCSKNGISKRLFLKKQQLFQNKNVTLVGCSQWIANEGRKSAVAQSAKFTSIPNAIDTKLYQPMSQAECREMFQLPQNKKLILYGACKATDKRKGVDFLPAMFQSLNHSNEDSNVCLVVFGSQSEELSALVDVPVLNVGYIRSKEKMIQLYNAVDLFLIPSLEDNLPNTIMESMACGTPCVGFKTGGIPEMIDHKQNGYIAEYQDAEDLARGIRYVLEEADYEQISHNARQKVEQCYAESVVATRYMELYEKLVSNDSSF